MDKFCWFWLGLLLMVNVNKCSICNYLYEKNASRAYPTDVCMQLGSNSYIKYQCNKSSLYPSNYTITMQSFSTNTCSSDSKIQEFDLNEWIIYQNSAYNTSIQISYNCGGIDNCFIELENECDNNNINDINIGDIYYYPLQECLNHHNKSISFKYECGTYYEYNGSNCIEDNLNQQISLQSYQCINQIDCKSTPAPTSSPSWSPSPSPTSMPSKAPTYYIPFYNYSLENIIDLLKNKTFEDSTRQHHLTFIFLFIVFMITIIS